MKALEPDVFHDRMGDTDTVEGFNPGRTIGENTDGPGRSNRRDRRVPSGEAFGFQPTARIGWEGASLLCQLLRRFVGPLPNKSHQLIGDVQRVVGIVWNTELNEKVGKSHDAEPDFSGTFRPRLDGCQGVTGSIEHIVEKADRQRNNVSELFVVDSACASMCGQTSGDIDRSERA